jgi:hypothetical protein
VAAVLAAVLAGVPRRPRRPARPYTGARAMVAQMLDDRAWRDDALAAIRAHGAITAGRATIKPRYPVLIGQPS